jgi:type II secretory pathway predicted ATPase ExeA
MHQPSAGSKVNPFNNVGQSPVFVPYRSQRGAFKFLDNVLTDERGIGVLHGPAASGKSFLLERFIRELQTGVAVAVVDGAELKTADFLGNILTQYGYDVVLDSADELLSMLTVFAVQQSRVRQVPVLVIENINAMCPGSLCALCKLALITTRDRFALRIVLVSNRDFRRVIDSPGMTAVARRMVDDYELRPMTCRETSAYLYAKLRAGGVLRPDDVFSGDVCDELHTASEGWPGKLDQLAQSLIEQTNGLPIRVEDVVQLGPSPDENAPQFIVTLHGKTLHEFRMSELRSLIGRAHSSDLVLEDQFVSKQHALLLREGDAVILVDLKSANGIYVNSRRVQRAILRDCDVISLGDHRIKIHYTNRINISDIEDPDLADTATMKNLADAHRAKVRWDQRVAVIAKKRS